MKSSLVQIAAIVSLVVNTSCGKKSTVQVRQPAVLADSGALLRVGSVNITAADVDYQLKERHAGRTDGKSRQVAIAELTDQARFTQAALDAGMDQDPAARAEIARILVSQLKENQLSPKLKAIASGSVADSRLREIYDSQMDRFQSAGKRKVAVLWLNPGADDGRIKQYQVKLAEAREWYLGQDELVKHPDQGFSVLSVDYSEHAASRYKNGVIGWMESKGGMDPWSKAVADIAYSLQQPGEISAVVTRDEGVFLVRYMAEQPAFLHPFESVSDELSHSEKNRLRKVAEAEFESSIRMKYPATDLSGDAVPSETASSP